MIKFKCTDLLSLFTKQDLLKLSSNNYRKSIKKELLITNIINDFSLDPLTDCSLINFAIRLNISNDFISKINLLPLEIKFFWIKQEIINMNSGVIKESKLVGRPLMFDFYSNWDSLIKPHLLDPYVQFALNQGMEDLEYNYKINGILCENYRWYHGKAPYSMSQSENKHDKTPRLHSLDWYRPLQCCHWILPFSFALGEIICPELEWKYRHSRRHSVAIGYEKNINNDEIPIIIFDILNYECNYLEILDLSDSKLSSKDYSIKWRDGVEQDIVNFAQNKRAS